MIHPTAIIHPHAKLAADVKVGPYAIIEEHVEIGEACEIGSHAVIKGHTKIGSHNKIFQFCSIGEDPQDKKYTGAATYLEIGDHNVIREFCTLNRGTEGGGGVTRIGNHNLLMAYVHIAHDCVVGNHVVFANNASLAGHVQVDDFAILGGLSGTHQFCRIGMHSFAAGGSMIAKDVPPYVKVSGYYAKPFGLNTEGLRRHGFTSERLIVIKQIYKIVYRQGLNLHEAVAKIQEDFPDDLDAERFISVLEHSKRGVVR